MIRSILGKKEYFLIFLFIFLIIFVNQLSLSYINKLQKNAEVINYISILKGTTERLVKEGMQGFYDDNLISYIDSIIYDLIYDKGEIGLVVIQDTIYLNHMTGALACWGKIKDNIVSIKLNKEPYRIFELSDEFFNIVDEAAVAAEAFAERKLKSSRFFLRCANIVFIIFIMTGLVYFLKAGELKRKSAIIREIAYVDTLTQMPNRASCEIEIDKYRKKIPPDLSFAVLLFDMNNLEDVNAVRGRHGGDRVIAGFGRILKEEAEEFGFVGRYGGVEFLGIFQNSSREKVEEYIKKVNKKVAEYNKIHTDDSEKKISFAIGYSIGDPGDNNFTKLINNADKLMYENKRKMREKSKG
ncbi:MAG: GGDEF domain-containing protein [Spirochaetaceae bacterium]|nr:GGDEF domain-containing protein [Spirochaetaceae bacterium]